jgi:hypothetical protein
MPIKYGELTLIYDRKQTIFSNLLMWLKSEDYSKKEYKYIFLFDDGEICDADDKLTDCKFKYCESCLTAAPLYFEKPIKNKEDLYSTTYFSKKPNTDTPGVLALDFTALFSSYSKYNRLINIPSAYNCIYYRYKRSLNPEIFGLIHIKSNDYMPRFQFAYDSDEFTKEEIVYVIHSIFNPVTTTTTITTITTKNTS